MSDILFDEVIIDGKKYEHGEWKKYAIHDEWNIKGFFGDYRFMSNFYTCNELIWGLYPSVENAYQAMKVIPEERSKFYYCSAKESKNLWKTCSRSHTDASWNEVKFGIMKSLVCDKFLRNSDLAKLLKDTLLSDQSKNCYAKGNLKYLEETNWWGDEYWGVNCFTKQGHNALGRILMSVRSIL